MNDATTFNASHLGLEYPSGYFKDCQLYQKCRAMVPKSLQTPEERIYYDKTTEMLFVVLLIEVRKTPKPDNPAKSQPRKRRKVVKQPTKEVKQQEPVSEVKVQPEGPVVTTIHEIGITHHPILLEIWKNKFDDQNEWKKTTYETVWPAFLAVGPFTTYEKANLFTCAWVYLARGLKSKILKVRSVVEDYNRHSNIRVSIFLTPRMKQEYFDRNLYLRPKDISRQLRLQDKLTTSTGKKRKHIELDGCKSWTINMDDQGQTSTENSEILILSDVIIPIPDDQGKKPMVPLLF